MLTQDELKTQLHYNPETGIFKWMVTKNSKSKINTIAGTSHYRDYNSIKIDNVSYKTHRLAWFYMTGLWPKNQIDHINRIRGDVTFMLKARIIGKSGRN